MKPIFKPLALSAFLGASLHLQAELMLVPNGDFETADGESWAEINGGGGTFAYSYPSDDGGNPGGYGVIDNTGGGGWGIWVANGNAAIPLGSLGLTAGESYRFSQDMKILSGPNIGGFKVDFFSGESFIGSTGDKYPVSGTSDWVTYTFRATIPAAADGIKVVPLWGPDSSVGYDNISVESSPIQVPLIPNGDFNEGSASWFEIGAPNTTYSYPSSGGNTYGVMTNDGGGMGTWVANGGAPLSLASLGFAGGNTVTFMQDMTLLTGSNIGGLRIEFFQGAAFLGDTGNMTPDLIGNGSTWETYSFEVTIPPTADHIKLVPLWGPGSSVGYDNFTYAVSGPEILAMEVTLGTAVSWETSSEVNLYQAQKSDNGVDWVNLGRTLVGNSITSAFDREGSPFYRVLETPVGIVEAALNGGFETADPSDSLVAQSWTRIGSQPPSRITGEFRSGNASMQIKVLNDDSPNSNNSEIQQNTGAGSITPGESYDFSFWAKQITSGVSYVQRYRLQWLAPGGAPLAGGFEFTDFAGGTGQWTKITAANLVAPDGAETAMIQIFGTTGAVPGSTAQGEVLIDDLSLVTASTGPSTVESTLNGDFELLDPNDFSCSEFWFCDGTQPPTNIAYDSLSGIAAMELWVQNDGSANPNSSEIRHDILAAGGTITPGGTYDFSFWAKQIVSGVSYVQQYRLQWLAGSGAILPGGIEFTPFVAGNDGWTEIAVPGLVAPEGAATALIQIVASTGSVPGASAEGMVLIDDVSLAAPVTPDTLPASSAAGVGISWGTEAGKTYQLRRTLDLDSFADFGPPITGDGGMWTATDVITAPAQFYNVLETAP